MSEAFLVEIGTEELPPKALRGLMTAFGEGVAAGLDAAPLAHGAVTAYASPRRLAVRVAGLAAGQPDRHERQKGPPVRVAFDADGVPTAAAEAFAGRCGVRVDDLGREKTDKGEWLVCDVTTAGQSAAELLPGIVDRALAGLPIPRRMRWGAGDAEFVRPVHWLVMLHGSEVIDASILGVRSGDTSAGHRFHADGPVTIAAADDYLATLESEGFVIADFERRRAMVQELVDEAAATLGGTVVDGEALYDEVAALVEWPVPIVGAFDESFLALPREVIVSTLTGHQRYFPLAGKGGALLPNFITVANLESRDPDAVRDGNERVIRPRLADAAFFWDTDQKAPLEARVASLGKVVYQQGLGSLADKSERVVQLAGALSDAAGADAAVVARAARLAKCDLVTGMVGEFPELQGTMGRYYALADGEPQAVADAIGEHYRPRFAGDDLPATPAGRAVAIADKLDTLAGIFAIGKKPSGNRDPFGLRRAALGVVRLLIEGGIDVDLAEIVAAAVERQPQQSATAATDLLAFIVDRHRSYCLDRSPDVAVETIEAVWLGEPRSLTDFDARLHGLQSFMALEQAASLAAANKRIANILRKADTVPSDTIDEGLFSDDAETALAAAVASARTAIEPVIERRDYAQALAALAALRDPVDRYFDDVMVMVDDPAVRNNRLALLGSLRSLFLEVADISRLDLG